MTTELDYLDHLAHESARFLDALSQVPPDARVPTCPDWDADDLLWHLAEVQFFWGTIVREKLAEPSGAEALKPERPADRADLTAFYQRASHDLWEILSATPPETTAWTWSDEQSVGFIRRRQAHEALIHRIDAELTADNRSAMDRRLSADGVDEVLRIMYGGHPPWGSFAPDDDKRTLRLMATDTGDSWFVTLGRFTGTDPADNTTYDEPDIQVADDPGGDASATISAAAADLDCWLWHRPTVETVDRSGDQEVLGDFDKTIAPGIN